MTERTLPTLAAGLLLATAALHAAAQAPAKTATREELRACMNAETEIADKRKALDGRNQKSKEEAAAIKAEAQQLAEEQKKAEEDPNRMERFNRRVKAHNARIETANKELAVFKGELEQLNQQIGGYNVKCGAMVFKPEDREALLKEREAAKK